MATFQIAFYLILNILYLSLHISHAQTPPPTPSPTSSPNASSPKDNPTDIKEIIFIICGIVIIILLIIIGGLLYIIMRYGNQKKRRTITKGTIDFKRKPTDAGSTFVASNEQQNIIRTTQTSPNSIKGYNTSLKERNSHSLLNKAKTNPHSKTHSQQLQLSHLPDLPHSQQFQPKLQLQQPQQQQQHHQHFANMNSLTFNSLENKNIQHMAALNQRDAARNNSPHQQHHNRQPSNAIVNVIVPDDDANDGDDNTSTEDQDGERSSSSSFTLDGNPQNNDEPDLDELANDKGGIGGVTPNTPSYPKGAAGASHTHTHTHTHSGQLTVTHISGLSAISGITGLAMGGNIPGISGYEDATPTQGSGITRGSGVGGIQLPKPKTKGHWM